MSLIRECFESRFQDGVIIEVDWTQLEVIWLAFVSGDKQLIADLKNKIDMHCMSASFLYQEPYERILKEYKSGNHEYYLKRKKAKGPSFSLQYGSGWKNMVDQYGVTKKQAQTFIANYYARYSGVKAYQDLLIEEVKNNAVTTEGTTALGLPRKKSTVVSFTGRRYTFFENDTPESIRERGVHKGFSPTQIKNYPIQGGATADFAPMAFSLLYENILKNGLIAYMRPIMTTHDSAAFDTVKEYSKYAIKVIKETFEHENIKKYMSEYFSLDIPIELRYSISMGKNLNTLEEVAQ